jgi:peptide/nickel transport system substrate-binding protein
VSHSTPPLARAKNFGSLTLMLIRAVPLIFALLLANPAAGAGTKDCGTIIIPPGIGAGTGADVTSLNPQLVQSLYNQEAADLMFMQLIWVNRFHTIDYSRSLAASVTTPDAGKTYNISLRPWHWSDGVAVSAADVAYTFNMVKQLGGTWPGYGTGGMPDIIASFTVNDPTHFTIVLKRRVNPEWFILNGLQTLVPVPAHIWGRYTQDEIWQNQSSPAFFQVVDGPLVIKRLVIGQYAEFVPNPAYEGPKMHFSRFIMKFMDSENAEMQAVESGDLDMANVPFPLWNMAQHLPGLHIVTLEPAYSWNELIPNIANENSTFFADVRVRQALADAISQQQIIQLAMHGQGDPVYNGIPPVPASFLSPAARSKSYPVGYNPQKARALLAAAGFSPGPDGIMQKHGVRLAFTILVPAGQELRIEIAESIQQTLRAAGIEMKVHQVEFNQVLDLLVGAPQKWQAILLATTITPYPTGEASFVTGAFYNNNGYSDPTMDSLITASTDKPGMNGLFAYEDYAAEQQPVIFLPVEKYSVLVRNGLHGVNDFINPLGFWSPEQLYCGAR